MQLKSCYPTRLSPPPGVASWREGTCTRGGMLDHGGAWFRCFFLGKLVSVFMPMFHVNHSPCFLKRSERGDDVEATFEKTPDFIPVALALFCAVSDLSFK